MSNARSPSLATQAGMRFLWTAVEVCALEVVVVFYVHRNANAAVTAHRPQPQPPEHAVITHASMPAMANAMTVGLALNTICALMVQTARIAVLDAGTAHLVEEVMA